MKIKVIDAIRRTSDEQVAKIIGAIVLKNTKGISIEEALDFDFTNTLKALQQEIEIDCKQTNADRIRFMNDEELAELLDDICTNGILAIDSNMPCDCCTEKTECKDCWKDWLQSEAEE